MLNEQYITEMLIEAVDEHSRAMTDSGDVRMATDVELMLPFEHSNNDGFKTPTIDPKQTPVIHSMWLIVIIVAILAWRRR